MAAGKGLGIRLTRIPIAALTAWIEIFGSWEQIFGGELDGCRRSRVLVKIMGGGDSHGNP